MYSDMVIAVVDDDTIDRTVLTRLLKKIDFQGTFRWFCEGLEFIDWLRKTGDYQKNQDEKPSLIFLDIGLPSINGKQVLKTLRTEPLSMAFPVVMLSGSNSQKDYQDCIQLGANGYIVKSSDIAELNRAFLAALESWSSTAKQVFI